MQWKLECSTPLRRNWIDPKYWTPNSELVIDWTVVIDEIQIGSQIRVSSRLSRSTTHWLSHGKFFGSYSKPGTWNNYQAKTFTYLLTWKQYCVDILPFRIYNRKYKNEVQNNSVLQYSKQNMTMLFHDEFTKRISSLLNFQNSSFFQLSHLFQQTRNIVSQFVKLVDGNLIQKQINIRQKHHHQQSMAHQNISWKILSSISDREHKRKIYYKNIQGAVFVNKYHFFHVH